MGVIDLFSKRKKLAEKEASIKPIYDLPVKLRTQIVHIVDRSLGIYVMPDRFDPYMTPPSSNQIWDLIHRFMLEEKGLFSLSSDPNNKTQCLSYILNADTDDALDIIELAFKMIDTWARRQDSYNLRQSRISYDPDQAIIDLNVRFQENNVGYRFREEQIIKMDTEYHFKELIEPALNILNEAEFRGASDEFLKGMSLIRSGNTKEGITNFNSAFESTMKSICEKNNWNYKVTWTAKRLIEVCFENGLIPSELKSHFSGLISTLESGLPTLRNKKGGHGQGLEKIEVPEYLAYYAANLAASNILLLVEAYKKHL